MNTPAQPEGSESAPLIVTVEDHFNGFKVVPVEYRSGARQEIRLTAPSRRKTRARFKAAMSFEDEIWATVEMCLPEHLAREGERFLDLLDKSSAELVEVTAYCLTHGLGVQKKIEQVALATALASSAPSSASAAPAGPEKSVTPGAGPFSGSGSPSPSSKS